MIVFKSLRLETGPDILMNLFFKTLFAGFALLTLSLTSANAGEGERVDILLFGDSIAAGYGLAPQDALVGQLDARLRVDGLKARVLNGGVSGDTTAGGLARLGWTLSETTDVVIIVLGGNDAMRGLTPSQSEGNLDELIADLKARGLQVLLTGMRAPPNLGPEYAAAFEPMYERLAAKHGTALYPFILEGVAADPALNQGDGIHPNAKGVAIIIDGLAPLVARLVKLTQQNPS